MSTPRATAAAALSLATTLALTAGVRRANRAMHALYPPPLPPGPTAEADPVQAPERLTAAVLLDHAGTEVSDFLVPYELLAASDAFNVHAVAPEARPAMLSGGLDVLPQLSHTRFAQLVGHAPDLVVVPHMPAPDRRVVDWIRSAAAAGATVLSICTGAGVVAATGLLDGRPATAHWGDLRRFDRQHPEVEWRRGVRYVDDGDVVASAGITSGIDATLHVIRRLAGDEAMRRAADAIGYTDLGFLEDPSAPQHRGGLADVILPLTAAFGRRTHYEVLLRDDVSETALAALMDTYAASFTARTSTATPDGEPIRTRHGLTILPRHAAGAVASRRVLHPADTAPYLAMHQSIDDLARSHGPHIARFAAKRLELRTPAPPPATAPRR